MKLQIPEAACERSRMKFIFYSRPFPYWNNYSIQANIYIKQISEEFHLIYIICIIARIILTSYIYILRIYILLHLESCEQSVARVLYLADLSMNRLRKMRAITTIAIQIA